MYDRNLAVKLAYEESRIPKDKINWIRGKNTFVSCAVDKEALLRLKFIKDNALDFVKLGKDLLICSPVAGNGKTTWACMIAMNYIQQFVGSKPDDVNGLPVPRVTFVNVPEYFMQKKASLKDSALAESMNALDKRINSSPLVIWDDIVSKGASEYEDGILYVMLNNRISQGKSNIFTSNVVPDDMEKFVSGTVASRIKSAGSDGNCIILRGDSLRGVNFIHDNNR